MCYLVSLLTFLNVPTILCHQFMPIKGVYSQQLFRTRLFRFGIFFKNPVILMNSKQLIEIELFAQEQQKEIFAKALQYWADVSKLSFRSVESPSEADIKIR